MCRPIQWNDVREKWDARGTGRHRGSFGLVYLDVVSRDTTNRQPPIAANRQLVSCPCLDHEAESVPVKVRFCWRYEPSPLPLQDSPGYN